MGGQWEVLHGFGRRGAWILAHLGATLISLNHQDAPTHNDFLPLNLFVARQRTGTRPAQFWCGCFGVEGFPMSHLPMAQAAPQSSRQHRGCGGDIGHGEQPGGWGLDDVRAEEDLFPGRKMSRGRKV